jgi:hypothetical protein
MKTYAVLIAALLCAGFLLTSCQKDNSLAPASNYENAITDQKEVGKIDPKPVNDQTMLDPINNYPDPFTDKTTLEFNVWQATKVSLIIYDEAGNRVELLVAQFLPEGIYRQVWDSKNARPGTYVAVLRVGKSEIKEVLTKVHSTKARLPGSE